jgi:branched-chain amino acid transport system substrate-binding protein
VADINAAGGVLGGDVVLEQGDSGDTTTDIASTEVDRLLALGADAIMGAASSAVSKTVIDKITGAGVIQFSPANTSPDFTTYDDNGLYFRTAPSDLLQGRVLANAVLDQGNESASVLFRQESYGQGLADAFMANFEASGGVIDEFLPYAIDVESFDAEIDTIVEAGSDAVIVIGFAESANILTTMHERGVGPTSDTNVWGVDGNDGINGEMADATILEGMKQTIPSVDLAQIGDFITRLEEAMPPDSVSAYGAETYDSVIIVALAAEIAGSDAGVDIAAEINGVTKDGEKCNTFADCKAIIEAGGDPDYDGLGGPYEFVDAGEPAAASFRIQTYGTDGRDDTLDEYVFAS